MSLQKYMGFLTPGGGGVTTWDSISGKPSTFSPDEHTHVISNVTNLQSTLNGKATTSHSHSEYSLTSHNHNSQYSSLNHNHDSQYSPKSHTHSEYSPTSHNHDAHYSVLSHTHSEYSLLTHVHTEYSLLNHSHDVSVIANLRDFTDSLYAVKEHMHDGYALLVHNHHELYSQLDHTHDQYSMKIHNHNDLYSSLNHTHSAYANKTHSHSEYSLVDHAHDTQYSALDHTHEDYAERTWVTEQLAQLQGSIGAPIDLTDQFRDVAVINIDTNGILYLIVGEKRGIGTPVPPTGGGSGAIISNYPSIFINDQLVVSGALMHGVASHLTEYFGPIKAGDVVTLALERTINGEVYVGDLQPESLIRAILYPKSST